MFLAGFVWTLLGGFISVVENLHPLTIQRPSKPLHPLTLAGYIHHCQTPAPIPIYQCIWWLWYLSQHKETKEAIALPTLMDTRGSWVNLLWQKAGAWWMSSCWQRLSLRSREGLPGPKSNFPRCIQVAKWNLTRINNGNSVQLLEHFTNVNFTFVPLEQENMPNSCLLWYTVHLTREKHSWQQQVSKKKVLHILCFINIIRSISAHSHTDIDCKSDKAGIITQCVYLEVNDKSERFGFWIKIWQDKPKGH